MNPICNKIASTSTLNANYDIVWSFQYSLSGNNTSSGGFATFLYDPSVCSTLYGGGTGIALGVSAINAYPCLSGIVLAVGFDQYGAFGGYTYPNSFTICTGANLNYVTTVPLYAFNVSDNSIVYKTLRFRLFNIAQTLEVCYLSGTQYQILTTVPIVLSVKPNTGYNIGLAYSTPITATDTQSVFSITNFHTHGISQNVIPQTTTITPNPMVNTFTTYVAPSS